jgi:hypothetical protein
MKLISKIAGVISILTLSTACGSSYNSQQLNGAPGGEGLVICSPLDFTQVDWSGQLSPYREQALELALNISGSFEGSNGWANLTNNFDGQGLSMGLLNQTLGTGSLQPLLIQMQNNHMDVLQNIFSSAHLQSLLGMLAQWNSDNSTSTSTSSALSLAGPQVQRLSVDDKPKDGGIDVLSVATNNSVTWAVNNLYSGSNFIPQWQTELTALGQSPEYVSIQVDAALTLHLQTIQGMAPLQVNELRAYLTVFDIVVQDGGIYAQDFTDYATWLGQNPQSSTTARLNEMLTLRLRHVQAQYVADVQSRKLAIINGSGVVHGASRNLEQQYCFNRLEPYQN